MKTSFALIIFTMVLFLGCTKKVKNVDLIVNASEIAALATQENVESVSANELVIDFTQYSMGVNPYTSKAYKFNNLIFYAIEYPNQESAYNEARRLNQFYLKNWLFDGVQGEPLLIDLVKKAFGARAAVDN